MRHAAQKQARKHDVQVFWNTASCGEEGYAIGPDEASRLAAQAQARYRLEPYLKPFARFAEGQGKDVLEIGVGMGADHLEWAKSGPKSLTGVDLTPRAVAFTQARFNHALEVVQKGKSHGRGAREGGYPRSPLEGALGGESGSTKAFTPSNLQVADAENLPFRNESFDLVYSWGVLHHSPDTPKAFAEACRVLRKGGTARIMVYHTWSLTGLMLWARFALLKGKPRTSMAQVYSTYLESPGTKAYTTSQARELCRQAGFSACTVHIQLNHGDLLEGSVGQRHQGRLLNVAKALWPRPLFKALTPFLGLYLMIEATK